jgi:hypothetical protein
MDNSLIMNTFLTQMDECLEDISKVYAVDNRFLKCKLYYEGIKKSNPKMIISVWKNMVTDKYGPQIEEGNIQFFLEKNYKEDAPGILYTPTVDNTIQEIREAIKTMSEENKAISLKYIQNLCKLSKLYVY